VARKNGKPTVHNTYFTFFFTVIIAVLCRELYKFGLVIEINQYFHSQYVHFTHQITLAEIT